MKTFGHEVASLEHVNVFFYPNSELERADDSTSRFHCSRPGTGDNAFSHYGIAGWF